MTIDAPELGIAAAIFVSGVVLAWLISAIGVIVDNRLSTQPRDRRAWRRAHRQALFWQSLRNCGYDAPVAGFGRLMEL